MTTETTNSTNTASVNPVSQITDLLVSGMQTDEEVPNQEEEGAVTGEPDTSTDDEQGGESGNENAEGDEDESPVGSSDDEVTWAGVLGVDDSNIVLDEEGNLQGLVVKVDGVSSTVSVKDLVAGYQTNKHYTQKSQALAEERREFEKVRGDVAQNYSERLAAVDKLTGFLYDTMTKEFQNINWEKLRSENPGEYAAAVADYQTRDAQFKQIMAAVQSENGQLQQQHQAQYNAEFQKHLAGQYEKVLENNPSWRDTEKMQKELNAIGDSANEVYGIHPEEFKHLNDARHLEIIKDAIAYRKGKTVSDNKIKTAPPKFQKAGGKSGKPMSKLTRLTLDARKAQGSRQRDLQTAAVTELLLGGR
jgi:hypothetical protein